MSGLTLPVWSASRQPGWRPGALALGVSILLACGGSSGNERDALADLPRYTEDGLRLIYSDTHGDGQADVIKTFREEEDPETGRRVRTLVRTELDLNGDGRINMRRSYDDDGALLVEEMDGDLDGRIDHTVHWDGGVIMRSETDTRGDGRVDEWREYRDGFLTQVRRDTTGDGRVDTWSYYDRRGLVRLGYDTTGDGQADRWSQRSE